jgi:hypothetical protein
VRLSKLHMMCSYDSTFLRQPGVITMIVALFLEPLYFKYVLIRLMKIIA